MLKRVVSAVTVCLVANMIFQVHAIPQSTQGSAQSVNSQTNSQPNSLPLTQLGSEFHNGIELLQNRFRIDFEVDEITMIFFREYGSLPIVLVRPDGSKIYQTSADGENIFWFDSITYDMVSIKNPMPGPWQAVGQITPKSRVMVMSELSLHADPLPEIIFSGEILKQTAYLTNNGIPIDYTAFRDVVELTTSLSSTNNPNFNNFGANKQIVALFEDNGKGMDERPLDGIFTGQFNLAIADGEWIPKFSVSTPMFNREQVDPNIMLLANPIKVEVELDGGGDGYHKLYVDALREYVDMSTLLIDGKVRFPNGDIQNFSITDMSSDIREYLIVNSEYGVYRVKLTTYGSTVSGREFILDVPEYSFLSEEPETAVAATDTSVGDPTKATSTSTNLSPNKISGMVPAAEEGMPTSTLVWIIVGINLFILIVGGGLIWWVSSRKKPNIKGKDVKKTRDKSTKLEKETEKPSGVLTKIFKRKQKETADPIKPQNNPEPESGFIDLAVPKE